MNALDKVIIKERTESMWIRSEGNEWMLYCEDVEWLFNQFIFRRPFKQLKEQQVQDQWQQKWDFVNFYQGVHHIQMPLMLLMPTSVETLATALGKVKEAVTRISKWFIHIMKPSDCIWPVHIQYGYVLFDLYPDRTKLCWLNCWTHWSNVVKQHIAQI